MKNILILGGFGFIGSNILTYIDDFFPNNFNVIVFDKYKEHLHGLKFNCVSKVYYGDFSDELLIERILDENNIEFVIHLLSSTVPSSSTNVKFDVMSNLLPTLNLLNIMKSYNVKDIIYISSGGAIYGNDNIKHSEDDPEYPISSYGIVKLTIEKYLLLYSKLYNFKTLILRLSNPYGRFHYNNTQGICNVALRKALTREKIQIWGDGNGKKDYIFVDDFCKILFNLLKYGINTDVLNVGSGNLLSINEIIENVETHVPNLKKEYIEQSANDVVNFELDLTKLHNLLPNIKFTPFSSGIEFTYNWVKSTLY